MSAPDQLHKRCAWCRRWLVEGRWVALAPELEPDPEELTTTHGMCPDCSAAMCANLTDEDDAAPPTEPDPDDGF